MPASYHAIAPNSDYNFLYTKERDPNSDNTLLPPRSVLTHPHILISLDVPPSLTPTVISHDGSSITVPPSPTLPNASSFTHVQTYTALRNNEPEERPHSRKPSDATFNLESTQPEHPFLSSYSTDPVQRITINSGAIAVFEGRREGQSHGKLKKSNELQTARQTELAQNKDIDPTLFGLEPFEVAHILDLKNTEVLDPIWGTNVHIRYLSDTSADSDLSKHALEVSHGSKVHDLQLLSKEQKEQKEDGKTQKSQDGAAIFQSKRVLPGTTTSQDDQAIIPSRNITKQGDNIGNTINGAMKKLSPGLHLKREPTIDEATQVLDLTSEINITHPTPVSHGGFSFIYKGEWERDQHVPVLSSGSQNLVTKTEVAVKILRVFPRQTLNMDLAVRARKRLNREVNVWKRLSHPNIARFYGISFPFNGLPALVIQWYQNGTAPDFTKARPKEYRLTFVKEISRGLSYLHTLKPPVVHGDLKGINVLVDDDGHAVLTDFGLAKVLEEFGKPTGNTTTTVAGSLRWMAPELLSGGDNDEEAVEEDNLPSLPPTPTLSSDVWSFGCTVYELVTGKLPYHHRNDLLLINDIARGISPLRPNDNIIRESETLLGILNDCWRVTPSDRPRMRSVNLRLEAMH